MNCFSNKANSYVTSLPKIPLNVDKASADDRRVLALQKYYDNAQPTEYSETTEVQNNTHVKFNITSNLLFIVSDMGTGKSTQLKAILDDRKKYETIVCLGFRKTFVADFKQKYDLTSYDQLKGPISLTRTNRLII